MALASRKRKLFDDRYEILSIVGRGSRSVVYHARLLSDSSSEVALKVLLDQKDHVSNSEKLRKEALAMVSSRHRYVVRLDDFHSVGALCYLSMEFAPESDLRKYVTKNGGKLDIKRAETFLMQSAKALAFIHKSGILHRDIKPDNLLVISDHEIRIADFGVALLPGETSSIEELQRGIGTMNYMPPEVLQSAKIDRTSDLYSLAVTFYEMLSNKHPFEDAPLARQLEIRQDKNIPDLRTLRSDIPEYLSDALKKAMSFNPADRYSTAELLIEAIVESRPAATPATAHKAKKKLLPAKKSRHSLKKEPVPKSAQNLQKKVPAKAPQKSTARPLPDKPEQLTQNKPRDQKHSPQRKTPDSHVAKDIKPGTGPAPVPATRKVTSPTPANNAPVLEHKKEIKNNLSADNPAVYKEKKDAKPLKKQHDYSADETVVIKQEDIKAKKLKNSDLKKTASSQNFLDRYIPHSKRKKLVITGLLTFAVLYFVLPAFRSSDSPVIPADDFLPAEHQELATFIPAYEGQPLSFPDLPAGLYEGTITGLQPGATTDLSIVSLPETQELIIVTGIEGWMPTISSTGQPLSLETDVKLPLRVSSSGFVLDFTGEVLDDEIIGFFRNIITGDTGQWSIKPVT